MSKVSFVSPTTTLSQFTSNSGDAFSLIFRGLALAFMRASLLALRLPPKPSESDESPVGVGASLDLLFDALTSPVGSWNAAYSLARTS